MWHDGVIGTREVRNRIFLYFSLVSVSVFEKKSDSVWNEFGSVRTL